MWKTKERQAALKPMIPYSKLTLKLFPLTPPQEEDRSLEAISILVQLQNNQSILQIAISRTTSFEPLIYHSVVLANINHKNSRDEDLRDKELQEHRRLPHRALIAVKRKKQKVSHQVKVS